MGNAVKLEAGFADAIKVRRPRENQDGTDAKRAKWVCFPSRFAL